MAVRLVNNLIEIVLLVLLIAGWSLLALIMFLLFWQALFVTYSICLIVMLVYWLRQIKNKLIKIYENLKQS